MASERRRRELVDDFTWLPAPAESVARAMQRQHPHLMVFRLPCRVARDDDVVANLQRVSGHTLGSELAGTAPLDRIAHDLAVLFFHVHVHPRMRVAEQELNDVALDGDVLVFKVGGRERVVGIRLCANETRGSNKQNDQETLHVMLLLSTGTPQRRSLVTT